MTRRKKKKKVKLDLDLAWELFMEMYEDEM